MSAVYIGRTMLRVYLCVLVVVTVLGLVSPQDGESFHLRPSRAARSFASSVRRFFGLDLGLGNRPGPGHRDCGDPEACPPHHCRLDDAVVHGFCCGCAHPTDRVHVKCPPWLQCPLSPIPLCDDYNYMMDCCC